MLQPRLPRVMQVVECLSPGHQLTAALFQRLLEQVGFAMLHHLLLAPVDLQGAPLWG